MARRMRVLDFRAFAVSQKFTALVGIREILDRNVSRDLQEDTEDNGRQNR